MNNIPEKGVWNDKKWHKVFVSVFTTDTAE